MADSLLLTSGKDPENPSNLSSDIRQALRDLQKEYLDQRIIPLNWDKEYIAIPLEVKVNLPSRGTVEDIDIHRVEPIYLLLHREYYPYKAPSVHHNRMDFPESRLPHLNSGTEKKTASFCLHRGNIDNWFVEHNIIDIVERSREWLYDAAAGYLIRQGDRFEATRLSESAGYIFYDQHNLWHLINKNWRKTRGKGGYAFLLYKLLDNPGKGNQVEKYAIGLLIVPKEEKELDQLLTQVKINNYRCNKNNLFLFGFLVWPAKKYLNKEYISNLPKNFGQLQNLSKTLDLNLKGAINAFASKRLDIYPLIPVTLAIPRPQILIGTNSKIELINFIIDTSSRFRNEELDGKTKVEVMNHISLLTHDKAREVSSPFIEFDHDNLLFIGCGAIGSKLIFHFARSGQSKMTLIDNERLSPHNLVRHALLGNSIGMNKAEAIKRSIEEMFCADKGIKIDAITDSALSILHGKRKDLLNQHNCLIDSTASPVILDALCKADLPKTLSCYRCEIADNGNLGFLSQEGSKRNPRVDDLQIHLYYLARKNEKIAKWLRSSQAQREQELGSPLEEISIGISCNSETMKLADEVVSLHAAYFASGLRIMAKKGESGIRGRILINYLNTTEIKTQEEMTLGCAYQIEVDPLYVMRAENLRHWQIRIRHGIRKELHAALRQALPNETGGLLIGQININRNTIYITDFLPAPPDSDSFPYAFKRGCQIVPKEISNIENQTGKMLGYVGEWHTHPNGVPVLSGQDIKSAKEIKACLDGVPMPTYIMVVTGKGLHSYIFEPSKSEVN